MARMVLSIDRFVAVFAFILFLFVGMCISVPISGVSSESQLRDTKIEADNRVDADQALPHTAKSVIAVPHFLVEQRQTFSNSIESNHGQMVDGLPMYLHGQPASVKELLPHGDIRLQFDLSSIWEVKDNIINVDLNFMVHYSGDELTVSVNFCKITLYMCSPVSTVTVTPASDEGYYDVTVPVESLALSPPDNNILTFTIESNGQAVNSTVNETVYEPYVVVCSSAIPSKAPMFAIHKHKRSVPSDTLTAQERSKADEIHATLGEGDNHKEVVKRYSVTCVLTSHIITFADLGITNVAQPTRMDIGRCSGGCSYEDTYSNKGVKHSELMSLHAESSVSCKPLTYGPKAVLYYNPDASYSLVVEDNIIALSCGCR